MQKSFTDEAGVGGGCSLMNQDPRLLLGDPPTPRLAWPPPLGSQQPLCLPCSTLTPWAVTISPRRPRPHHDNAGMGVEEVHAESTSRSPRPESTF